MSTVALADVPTSQGCQSYQLLQPVQQSVCPRDLTAYAAHGRPSEPCPACSCSHFMLMAPLQSLSVPSDPCHLAWRALCASAVEQIHWQDACAGAHVQVLAGPGEWMIMLASLMSPALADWPNKSMLQSSNTSRRNVPRPGLGVRSAYQADFMQDVTNNQSSACCSC